MTENRTNVFIWSRGGFVRAGVLRTSEDSRNIQRSRFQYAASYLDAPDPVAIDPALLPLAKGRAVADFPFLIGAFADSYPDRWGEQIWMALARESGKPYTYFDALVCGAYDRIGALAFGPDEDAPRWEHPLQDDYRRRTELTLDKLLEAAERFQEEGYHSLPDGLKNYLSSGQSVGGSRPKALLTMDGASWIAKFPMPREDVWNEPLVEFASMTLAARLGLRVPEIRRLDVPRLSARRDGPGRTQAVFAIRRFDREGEQRRHVISAKTVLTGQDFTTYSYQDVARAVSRIGGRDFVASDRLELFKRAVFNVLINNEDDHLKNHALVRDPQGWRLSPLFDVVPSPQPTTAMQLSLGGQGTHRSIANACSQPEAFGLDRSEAARVATTMAEAFHDTWRSVFSECGVEGKDMDILRSVLDPRHAGA